MPGYIATNARWTHRFSPVIYAAHVASGKSLPLAFSTFVTQSQRSEGAAQTLVLARSFTRLTGIFVTWFKANDASGLRNRTNYLYHHHGAGAYNHAADSLEVQMQLGAKKKRSIRCRL